MSIKNSAIHLLNQLETVIRQLNDQQFCQPVEMLSNASIGQHVRHTLEFFLCLMDARNQGVINYDSRKREKLIEENVTLAFSVIKSIKEFLNKEEPDLPLTLVANYHSDEKESVHIASNFMRELAYTVEHAIHHMALIKVGILLSESEILLPEHFGVASSTIRYQKTQKLVEPK